MAITLQSDSELARKAAAGDQAAFIVLVERHQGMVSGVALSLLKDISASEDVAQETFLSAWKKISSLRDSSKIRPWLATIARNTALTHLRMKKKKAESRALEETMSDSSPGPDQVSAHKDDLSLVLTALETLPEKYRTPLILFYREDQSVAAVAEALGLSKDLAKQRLKRGRDQLRDEVESTLSKTLRGSAPTAVFTASVVTAISALTPTTASAAAGLSLSSVTTPAVPASTAVAIMNSSKLSLSVAALLGIAAIPAGYGMRALLTKESRPVDRVMGSSVKVSPQPFDRNSITIPSSQVVTEWKRLQEEYGASAETMPQLYAHIEGLPNGFLKEGLLSVLVTEWVATDASGGFDFFRKQEGGDRKSERAWRTAFLEEWLRTDSPGAIEGVRATGKKWGVHFAEVAIVLAEQEPDFFIAHLAQISLSRGGQRASERALLILAEHDHVALRDAAVAARQAKNATVFERAIGTAVRVWATHDKQQALDWIHAYEGEGKEYVLAGALAGLATVNPMDALREGLNHMSSRKTSSALHNEFVTIAAAQDLEGTLSWYLKNLSKDGQVRSFDYAMGSIVAKELAKDPTTFLNGVESRGQFADLLPAFEKMSFKEGYFTRWQEISNWLKTRPESASKNALSSRLAGTLSSENPPAAFAFVDGVTDPKLSLKLRKEVAKNLVDSPSLDAANFYRSSHPEWSRELTLAAFVKIGSSSQETGLPQYPREMDNWIVAAEEFEGEDFRNATSYLMKAYLVTDPTGALEWMESLPVERLPNNEQVNIFGGAFRTWMWENEAEALDWVSQAELGPYHDSCASRVVYHLSDRKTPLEQVWPWFESITQEGDRKKAFKSLEFGYKTTSGVELSARIQELDIPTEEKSFYLESLAQNPSAK